MEQSGAMDGRYDASFEDVSLDPNDINVDLIGASDPFAVRITFLPTGETFTAGDQPTTLQNKARALELLRTMLRDREPRPPKSAP